MPGSASIALATPAVHDRLAADDPDAGRAAILDSARGGRRQAACLGEQQGMVEAYDHGDAASASGKLRDRWPRTPGSSSAAPSRTSLRRRRQRPSRAVAAGDADHIEAIRLKCGLHVVGHDVGATHDVDAVHAQECSVLSTSGGTLSASRARAAPQPRGKRRSESASGKFCPVARTALAAEPSGSVFSQMSHAVL